MLGPERRQNGEALERRVLFATKKSGEKIELIQRPITWNVWIFAEYMLHRGLRRNERPLTVNCKQEINGKTAATSADDALPWLQGILNGWKLVSWNCPRATWIYAVQMTVNNRRDLCNPRLPRRQGYTVWVSQQVLPIFLHSLGRSRT